MTKKRSIPRNELQIALNSQFKVHTYSNDFYTKVTKEKLVKSSPKTGYLTELNERDYDIHKLNEREYAIVFLCEHEFVRDHLLI